jgi:hypothetical protein
VDDIGRQPGEIFKGWEAIHRALLEAMKVLPRRTLSFMADRASDRIIRSNATYLLDWLDNRHRLPDWGWAFIRVKEGLRCAFRRTERVCGAGAGERGC